MYTLNKKVLLQRDYRINPNETISDFVIRYDGDLNPADAIAVVAVDGVPFELNMTAAIILETLLNGTSCEDTAMLIKNLFSIEYDLAFASVNEIIKTFTEKNIITFNK